MRLSAPLLAAIPSMIPRTSAVRGAGGSGCAPQRRSCRGGADGTVKRPECVDPAGRYWILFLAGGDGTKFFPRAGQLGDEIFFPRTRLDSHIQGRQSGLQELPHLGEPPFCAGGGRPKSSLSAWADFGNPVP